MSDLLGGVVGVILFGLYIFGMYNIVNDDHRYTTKDVAIGTFVFPYPWWVGGKEIYKYATTSSEDLEMEERCLDAAEAIRMPRKSRLRFCECVIEVRDQNICKRKIFEK